jgi:hypothetical protein
MNVDEYLDTMDEFFSDRSLVLTEEQEIALVISLYSISIQLDWKIDVELVLG